MIDINKKPNLSIIVAMAENRAIGKNNDLLWHLSSDLKRFKKLTTGHPVVMGRRTCPSVRCPAVATLCLLRIPTLRPLEPRWCIA